MAWTDERLDDFAQRESVRTAMRAGDDSLRRQMRQLDASRR